MPMCDNRSVGILVWRHESLLLIDRRKPPYGLAPPSGHVDDHGSFENAARMELKEETGLTALSIHLVAEGRVDNACRRGGAWHYWKIFSASAVGELLPSRLETKGAFWATKAQIKKLLDPDASRTEERKLELAWRLWFNKIDILRIWP